MESSVLDHARTARLVAEREKALQVVARIEEKAASAVTSAQRDLGGARTRAAEAKRAFGASMAETYAKPSEAAQAFFMDAGSDGVDRAAQRMAADPERYGALRRSPTTSRYSLVRGDDDGTRPHGRASGGEAGPHVRRNPSGRPAGRGRSKAGRGDPPHSILRALWRSGDGPSRWGWRVWTRRCTGASRPTRSGAQGPESAQGPADACPVERPDGEGARLASRCRWDDDGEESGGGGVSVRRTRGVDRHSPQGRPGEPVSNPWPGGCGLRRTTVCLNCDSIVIQLPPPATSVASTPTRSMLRAPRWRPGRATSMRPARFSPRSAIRPDSGSSLRSRPARSARATSPPRSASASRP